MERAGNVACKRDKMKTSKILARNSEGKRSLGGGRSRILIPKLAYSRGGLLQCQFANRTSQMDAPELGQGHCGDKLVTNRLDSGIATFNFSPPNKYFLLGGHILQAPCKPVTCNLRQCLGELSLWICSEVLSPLELQALSMSWRH
jgi:hypothetical protein